MTAIETLRAKMLDLSLDGVLVLDELNQRYLSGFAFSDGLLFITSNSAYLVTDFRYFEMAEKFADKAFEVVMPDGRFEFLSEVISKKSCKTIGFEGGSVSYETYRLYADKLSPCELVNIGALIEELRQVKNASEINTIQKAQNITDMAFSHILKAITPNMTEIEVAAELEYVMRKNGADGFSFETIAVSGEASALPHGKPRNQKLSRGFLTMDFGARFDGYCSDMTRTIVIGKADADMKKLYGTVLSAQKAALTYLKEGAVLGEADRIARDIIDKEYSGTFGHSLGHSIGLYVHEAPGLSRRYFDRKARCGELFTVEPGIYVYGKYGCRIEDMVVIDKEGVYNFTHSTKDLIEIM